MIFLPKYLPYQIKIIYKLLKLALLCFEKEVVIYKEILLKIGSIMDSFDAAG